MLNRREQAEIALRDCIVAIGQILEPCDFTFQHDETQSSHTGPFASGWFVRGPTRIGISCRSSIDNVIYEHSFITEDLSSRQVEKFSTGHGGLMQFLGYLDEAHLISCDSTPDLVVSRNGGERLDALVNDLSSFVVPLFQNDMDSFCKAIRRGFRSYSIE